MIGNIHLLRAWAATAVVVYHCGVTFGLPHGTDFKAVAIFFVISGYLMSTFAHERPAVFVRKRLVRIVPLYWSSTLLTVCLFGGFAWHDWRDVALSLLFVPHISVQGNWHPTLGVGWTLVMEMLFYATFAASIAIGGYRAPVISAGIVTAAWIAAQLMPLGVWGIYLGSTYMLQFVVGIGLYYAVHFGGARLTAIKSRGWLPAVLALSAAVCYFEPPHPSFGSYAVSFGVPATVVGAALLLARAGADIRHPLVIALGNASYALYVSHTIAIEWLRQKGVAIADYSLLVLPFVGSLTLVSFAVYRYAEIPAMRAINRQCA